VKISWAFTRSQRIKVASQCQNLIFKTVSDINKKKILVTNLHFKKREKFWKNLLFKNSIHMRLNQKQPIVKKD
jgi:hypothetical protein